MKILPNLAWLKAFEAAARLESFSLAADELYLTASAISHQIKNLEQHLEASLFVRSNRSVKLSAEGLVFYKRLIPVLEELEQACLAVSRSKDRVNILVLHCTPSLAVKWLGPRLAEFMGTYPQLMIRMTSSAEAPDLLSEMQIDCAVLYGKSPAHNKHIITEVFSAEPVLPLCSAEVYKQLVDVKRWYETLPLIESTLSPVSWEDWFGSQGLSAPAGPKLSFDRGAMAVSAAVDGLGVALETIRFAEKEILSGALKVLPAVDGAFLNRQLHFLSYRNNPEVIRRIAPFKKWLLSQAQVIPEFKQ